VNVGEQPALGGLTVFHEATNQILISCAKDRIEELRKSAEPFGVWVNVIGETLEGSLRIDVSSQNVINATIADLKQPWSESLEQTLHDHTANEVFA
jgi:phosphoribosylformylglycinamidine synthase